ncbi:hypothetical protein P3T27_005932, partial [Kitasatospora sp. MAA19]|nr:hypothetical protein [Kitasatospora sp. MAA19]
LAPAGCLELDARLHPNLLSPARMPELLDVRLFFNLRLTAPW